MLINHSIFKLTYELKIRLYHYILSFISTFAICCLNIDIILNILINPLQNIYKSQLIVIKLTELIYVYIIVAFFFATLLTLPILYFQFYNFILPALYPKEKYILKKIFKYSLILGGGSLLLTYTNIIPVTLQFLLNIQNASFVTNNIKFEPRTIDYIRTIINLFIINLFISQIPLVLIILEIFNKISINNYVKIRKIYYFTVLTLCFFIPIIDVLNQIIILFILFIFYEYFMLIFCFKQVYLLKNRNGDNRT